MQTRNPSAQPRMLSSTGLRTANGALAAASCSIFNTVRFLLLTTICSCILGGTSAAKSHQPRRLTHDGAFKFSPSFAAQGEEVLYAVHDLPNRVSMLRLRLSDGQTQVVDTSLKAHQLDPVESPSGRYLSFCQSTTSPQTVLVVRDRLAKTEFQFKPGGARATARGPRISADQQQIVFTVSQDGGQQIAAVDMQCQQLRMLTESSGTNCYPDLSPDGKQVAFCSSRAGSFSIYVMNADGSNVRRLTHHRLRDLRPAWSPDGRRIAFTSMRDANHEIYIVDVDGTNLRRVTNHPSRDDYPIWHPNGKQLLMVCERNGDSDLYLVDVGEPSQRPSQPAADAVPHYAIHRVSAQITIDGRGHESAWQTAPAVSAFRFSWWTEGKREQTKAKLLWDDRSLYVLFQCEDAHIWGEHTDRDSPVYRDDCVEVFTAPNPARPLDYFNFEMNVRQALLDQHHPDGPGKVQREWNSTGVKIAVSVDGTLNDDSDEDQGWTLEAAIPLANFAQVARHTPPRPGDIWHLNLNRLGGKTNPQYSQWSPSKTERPQFHAPQDFGRVTFVARTP